MMKLLVGWIYCHFRARFIFTPFATLNTKHFLGGGLYMGYTDIFVFGIRVARIHRTIPW